MAVIFSDNFDSYSNGNLPGQGSWTDGGNGNQFQVVAADATNPEGNGVGKQVNCAEAANVDYVISKGGTDTSDGQLTMYIKSTDVTNPDDVWRIRTSGGTERFDFRWLAAAVQAYIGGGFQNLTATATANTWHYVQCQWRSSDNQWRANYDGGAWVGWGTSLNTGAANQLWIDAFSTPGTHTFSIDCIAENTYGAAVAAARIKELTLLGVG